MMRLTLAMGRNLSCSFEELSEMLPEVGLPTGLIVVVGVDVVGVWFLFPVMLKS